MSLTWSWLKVLRRVDTSDLKKSKFSILLMPLNSFYRMSFRSLNHLNRNSEKIYRSSPREEYTMVQIL